MRIADKFGAGLTVDVSSFKWLPTKLGVEMSDKGGVGFWETARATILFWREASDCSVANVEEMHFMVDGWVLGGILCCWNMYEGGINGWIIVFCAVWMIVCCCGLLIKPSGWILLAIGELAEETICEDA